MSRINEQVDDLGHLVGMMDLDDAHRDRIDAAESALNAFDAEKVPTRACTCNRDHCRHCRDFNHAARGRRFTRSILTRAVDDAKDGGSRGMTFALLALFCMCMKKC